MNLEDYFDQEYAFWSVKYNVSLVEYIRKA